MKISVDIDGTLTEYPVFFEELRRLFRSGGHEVGLLTVQYPGQWVDTQMDGRWDFVVTCKDADERSFVESSSPVEWKKQKIKEHSIDLHFDDYEGFAFKVNK